MAFTLIRGTFHVVGYEPDGDSLKFKANNVAHWSKIKGRPKLNAKEHVQLRLEGIDALESHYRPSVPGAQELHQPLTFANAARDYLLAQAGIRAVVWNTTNRKVVSAQDGVPGYILTRAIDNPRNGRPVAFAFAGTPSETDGSSVNLIASRVRKSLNYKLLAAGHAYPTYYQTLFADLRAEFTRAVHKARDGKAPRGLWVADKSSGFTLSSLSTLTDKHPILPKLFRRLAEHLALGGTAANFRRFLDTKKDGVLILPDAHHTDALDYVVTVKNKKIGLNVAPENLIFDPE